MNDLYNFLTNRYRDLVAAKYPDFGDWPIASGCNMVEARYGLALIVHLKHTGTRGMHTVSPVATLGRDQVGVDVVTAANRSLVHARMEIHFRPEPKDMILVFADAYSGPDDKFQLQHAAIDEQLAEGFVNHEHVMGMRPMKIFLSHKGTDKARVREYHQTLKVLGFEPWLDEDAMRAGANLQRAILQGMAESCAAVFFVTPNYVDDNFLAAEIDHAIEEKRKKRDRFAIVTLVFEHESKKGEVPDLLRRYVWKEPANDLRGLREIIEALPVTAGPVRWRA